MNKKGVDNSPAIYLLTMMPNPCWFSAGFPQLSLSLSLSVVFTQLAGYRHSTANAALGKVLPQ
jgi:hypothetical protein